MSKILHWGLLSTAGINKALLEPLRQSPRSELVAVASRDLEKAKQYAGEEEIPKAHGSYEALLADPDVDVIYNPLPNILHADWTILAADAGKHVLCEKPIVTSLRDLDRVEAAATRNGVTVFEAFMYLHHPQTRRLLELVNTGALGRLQMITSWFHFYLPVERANNIRLRPELDGGSLWDVGVYPNSAAVALTGGRAPQDVWATQQIGETGVDVLMNAHLRFDDGAVAQISSGLRQPGRGALHVVGDAGEAFVKTPWKPDLEGPNGIELIGRNGARDVETFAPVNPYLCEVQAMEACVLDGAEPIVPLSLSREFLKSALAIYASAREGVVIAE